MALKTLTLTLKPGETIAVSGPASVRLESKTGSAARLAIMADESVQIDRLMGGSGDAAKRAREQGVTGNGKR